MEVITIIIFLFGCVCFFDMAYVLIDYSRNYIYKKQREKYLKKKEIKENDKDKKI